MASVGPVIATLAILPIPSFTASNGKHIIIKTIGVYSL